MVFLQRLKGIDRKKREEICVQNDYAGFHRGNDATEEVRGRIG